ncbi:MAG: hypothetical protein KF726_07450 [Anaerolineae bacterium]|nr:hypothetical protein [Anaerolineae bacterium]
MNIARAVTIIYGVITFFWLSPDEAGWLVIPLGIGGAVLVTLHLAKYVRKIALASWLQWTLFGAISGALATVVTAALMFFKTALHNHIYPDYPLIVILGMLARAPAWALAGALIGLALALVLPTLPTVSTWQQRDHQEQTN